MPYVITTSGPCGYCTHCGYGSGEGSSECLHVKRVSRVAVATLEEAREEAQDMLPEEWREHLGGPQYHHRTRTLPESGGTIGPLPDGTIIEVERVSLASLVHPALTSYNAKHTAEVLAAFNAS